MCYESHESGRFNAAEGTTCIDDPEVRQAQLGGACLTTQDSCSSLHCPRDVYHGDMAAAGFAVHDRLAYMRITAGGHTQRSPASVVDKSVSNCLESTYLSLSES